MTSLWDEPTEQIAVEAAARGEQYAIQSVAGFAPYVTAAENETDLANRLALLEQPIEASVKDATGAYGHLAVAVEHLSSLARARWESERITSAAAAIEASLKVQADLDWSNLRKVHHSEMKEGDQFYRPSAFEAYGENSQTGEVSGMGLYMNGRTIKIDKIDPDGTWHATDVNDPKFTGTQKPAESQRILKIVSDKAGSFFHHPSTTDGNSAGTGASSSEWDMMAKQVEQRKKMLQQQKAPAPVNQGGTKDEWKSLQHNVDQQRKMQPAQPAMALLAALDDMSDEDFGEAHRMAQTGVLGAHWMEDLAAGVDHAVQHLHRAPVADPDVARLHEQTQRLLERHREEMASDREDHIHKRPVDQRVADALGMEPAIQQQAVNESAQGTERYQGQPSLKRDMDEAWGKDPWDPPHAPEKPIEGRDVEAFLQGRTLSSGQTYTWHPQVQAATFSDETGNADEFAQMRTPTTSKPRVIPQADPSTTYTMPGGPETAPYAGQGGNAGGFSTGQDAGESSGLDYTMPTFGQRLAAKVTKIAHNVIEDNPHLSMEQAREIALQAVARHKGTVKGGVS